MKAKPVIAAIIEPMNRKIVEEVRPLGEPRRMIIVDDDSKGPINKPDRLIIRAEENKQEFPGYTKMMFTEITDVQQMQKMGRNNITFVNTDT